MPTWAYSFLSPLIRLAWDAWARWQQRRTKVTVLFGIALEPKGPPHGWTIIEVINESDHDVNITDVGLGISPGARITWPQPGRATLPGRVAPRDPGFTYRVHEPSGVPSSLLYGWATTATGETYRSPTYPEGELRTHPSFHRIAAAIRDARLEPWSL